MAKPSEDGSVASHQIARPRPTFLRRSNRQCVTLRIVRDSTIRAEADLENLRIVAVRNHDDAEARPIGVSFLELGQSCSDRPHIRRGKLSYVLLCYVLS